MSDAATYREHFRQAEMAADWLLKLETEGSSCHAEFAEWLKASPLHVHEFLAVSGLATRVRTFDPRRQVDVEQAIAQAKAGAVISLTAVGDAAVRGDSAHRQKFARWTVGLAAAVVIAAVGARMWLLDGVSNYATAVGEQRSVKLADGSIMVLNTRSQANVRFVAHEREVRLRKGEALFEVARDPARPFRVITGDAVVQAVGTQFNVRRNADATIVSVVEGSVRVRAQSTQVGSADSGSSPSAAVQPAQMLKAGEKAAVARNGRILKQTLADASEATAWRQRRLIFRENELAQVATEFNRYNELQIHVEGEGARRKVLTGAFNADNPRGLILFLRQDPSLQIDDTGRSVAIRQR